MIKFLTQLLDLIYKKRCYFCGRTIENTKMCSSCRAKIKTLPLRPIKFIDTKPVYSVCEYKNEIRKLIKGVKYKNQKELAIFQAKIMYEYWKKLPEASDTFVLVPVPLYKKREKKRKYNHMALVGAEFSRLTGYELCEDLIIRKKDTKPQYKLSQKERSENLHNAFECLKENYRGQKILIIDDILTTGSTLSEMVKTFEKSGIQNITCFVTSCTEFNLHH